MVMEEIKKIKMGDKDLRSFSWVVGGIFTALGLYFWWRSKPVAPYFVGIGATLLAVGLIWLRALKPVYHGWMILSILLGFVVSA